MENPIQAIRSAVTGERSEVRTEWTPAIGYSPIPVPYPKTTLQYGETRFIVPVSLAKESEPDNAFQLPTDPIVTVSGGNTIAHGNIADGAIRGTVKEFWSRGNYEIKISGILMSDDGSGEIGEDGKVRMQYYLSRLVELCEARENLIITCPDLNEAFGISRIAVKKVDFQPTDGENNQLFAITADSDDSYNLELEG